MLTLQGPLSALQLYRVSMPPTVLHYGWTGTSNTRTNRGRHSLLSNLSGPGDAAANSSFGFTAALCCHSRAAGKWRRETALTDQVPSRLTRATSVRTGFLSKPQHS